MRADCQPVFDSVNSQKGLEAGTVLESADLSPENPSYRRDF